MGNFSVLSKKQTSQMIASSRDYNHGAIIRIYRSKQGVVSPTVQLRYVRTKIYA